MYNLTTSSAQREYSLDFLKIVATILIIMHHYHHMFPGDYTFIQYFGGRFYFGYLVELFFILSGYFGCHMIIKMEKGSFSDYMLKRCARLLPLVIIAALMDQFLRWVGSGFDFSQLSLWGTFISSLGLQVWGIFENPNINGPMWYISVLLWCYVVFYFLTWLSNKLSVSVFWSYAVMVLIGVIGISQGIDLPFLNGYVSRGYAGFFFGLCFGLLLQQKEEKNKTLWYVLAGSFIVLFVICYAFFGDIVEADIQYILLFMVYPSIILLFKSPAVMRLFSSSIWGTMGKISFDVYVWHLNVIRVFLILAATYPALPMQSRLGMIVFVVCSVVVGILSYYLIEKKITGYLNRKYFVK